MVNRKSSISHSVNHILFSLAGGETTASTRIRYFGMRQQLEKKKKTFSIDLSLKQLLAADVYFIQKKLDKRILQLARWAKILGKLVIYDIDDFGYALRYYAPQVMLHEIIELSDLVTVGSESQKKIVKRDFMKERVQVFPPLIDYYPQAPLPSPDLADDPFRVLWFGLAYNLSTIEQVLTKIAQVSSVNLVVIAEEKSIPNLREQFPFIEFQPWSLATFVEKLRKCHISILSHDGNEFDLAKTNNKMITSISWGVPALVSNTPEYSKTARTMGVGNAVFRDTEELIQLIDYYRIRQAREDYLSKAQPIIWGLHSPEVITQLFIDFCREIQVENIFPRMIRVFGSHRRIRRM